MSEVFWEYVLAGLIVAAAVCEIWLEWRTARNGLHIKPEGLSVVSTGLIAEIQDLECEEEKGIVIIS